MNDSRADGRRLPAFVPAALCAVLVILLLSSVTPGLDFVWKPSSASAAAPPQALTPGAAQPAPQRQFETGYRIENSAIFDYFSHRGGEATFGQPISNVFILGGYKVQMFQRHIIQIRGDGSVGVVNLLDDMFPYTEVNGSTFPAADPALVAQSPDPNSPTYDQDVVAFVNANAPNVYQGQPINFGLLFLTTVDLEDAFPNGGGSEALLPLLNVEIWGLPTSRPSMEPRNSDFVYQRFQRGIFMFDASTGLTQPLLLADYFKSVLTGRNIPFDLQGAAESSPYYLQYDPSMPGSIARADEMPGSDLTGAFNLSDIGAQDDVLPAETPTDDPCAIDPASCDVPTDEPSAQSTPFPIVEGSSVCNGDESITFIPNPPKVGDNVLVAVTSAKQHVFTELYGTEKTTKVREGARPGQKGWVWEWTIAPTFNGPQLYTFYIDSTVPCVSIAFTVGGALETATPTPTIEPTATRTPKDTKTPTETRTPTETPTLGPTTAFLTRSKNTLRGDNSDSLTITMTLRDTKGNPASNIDVHFTVSGQDDGNVVQPDNDIIRTNGDGQAQEFYTADFCDVDPTDPLNPAKDRSPNQVTVTASYADADDLPAHQDQFFTVQPARPKPTPARRREPCPPHPV